MYPQMQFSMLYHGGNYRADDNRYFIFSFHYIWVSFWGSEAIFWAARTYLLLKENCYSIDSLKEKSFVGNYVALKDSVSVYSLYLVL